MPLCSDTIDNDSDGYIDTLDANCHLDGDLQKTYVPTWNSETTSPVSTNTGGGQGDTGGDLGYLFNRIRSIFSLPSLGISKFSLLGVAFNSIFGM